MARARWCLGLLIATTLACGGELFPADYAGPPAAVITGSVGEGSLGAAAQDGSANPAMTIVWLSGNDVVSQSVVYQRGKSLRPDWQIELPAPSVLARFSPPNLGRGVSIAVGRVV